MLVGDVFSFGKDQEKGCYHKGGQLCLGRKGLLVKNCFIL